MADRNPYCPRLSLHHLYLDRPPDRRAEEDAALCDFGALSGGDSAGGILCGRAPHDASIRLD